MTARRISDERLAQIKNLEGASPFWSDDLLDDLRDERALSMQLAEALREVEDGGETSSCPSCGGLLSAGNPHEPKCRLAAALAAYEARNKEDA